MTWRRLWVLPLAAWFLGAVSLDVVGLAQRPADEADLIVVAGCRVTPEGTASPCLAARVDRAVALWKEGRAPMMLVTGGVGEHSPAEAVVAARRAARAGVPEASIVVEARSTSTYENAVFAAQLASGDRVILVTDSFHLPRAMRVFGRMYPTVSGAASVSEPWTRGRGALREVAAFGWYAVQGRL